MCAKSYIAPDENRWSLEEEISKVFKTALINCYPDLPDEEPHIAICISEEPGDYRCNNFFSIYEKKYEDPITRKTKNCSKFIRRKRIVSEVLKKYLLKYAKDIIEKCTIEDIGFLHFTLSRSWIAESIHKMLTNGIDTLAPKYPVKRAVVDSSSRNIDEQMNVSHLHSALIGDTLARMLEFSKVEVLRKRHVWGSHCKQGFINESEIAIDALIKLMGVNVKEKDTTPYFSCIPKVLHLLGSEGLIENNEGELMIYIDEAMVRYSSEERKIPLTVVRRDGCFVATDLLDLCYQLEVEKADWIVYVADVGTQYQKEMCFMAARLARLLPTARYGYPRTTFVGVGPRRGQDNKRLQDPSTDITNLFNLFGEAKARFKLALLKQGKTNNRTAKCIVEALVYNALKYEFLKLRKVHKYTFNVDDMLIDKGNTLVHLLFVHTQISSFIKDSGKDIEELKKTGVLILEEDEERELGLHILQFTDVLNTVCTTIEPYILCEYLYELSKKFNRVYSVYSVCEFWQVAGSGKETSGLLLCEATLVVMRKCFHLLGINCIFEDSIKDLGSCFV